MVAFVENEIQYNIIWFLYNLKLLENLSAAVILNMQSDLNDFLCR